MKFNTFQILGLLFVVMGAIGGIMGTMVANWFVVHPPMDNAIVSYFSFLSIISSMLVFLGLFFLLWDLGKEYRAEPPYKTLVIIFLILTILFPVSFIILAFIGFSTSREMGMYIRIVVPNIISMLVMLLLGLALLLLPREE
jgi:hypothetical protein